MEIFILRKEPKKGPKHFLLITLKSSYFSFSFFWHPHHLQQQVHREIILNPFDMMVDPSWFLVLKFRLSFLPSKLCLIKWKKIVISYGNTAYCANISSSTSSVLTYNNTGSAAATAIIPHTTHNGHTHRIFSYNNEKKYRRRFRYNQRVGTELKHFGKH